MTDLTLDGSSWRAEDDFYAAMLPALGAPDWHGRNLDALCDSIGGDDINSLKLPYRIHIVGVDLTSAEARGLVERFRTLVDDLASQGHAIALTLSSN